MKFRIITTDFVLCLFFYSVKIEAGKVGEYQNTIKIIAHSF